MWRTKRQNRRLRQIKRKKKVLVLITLVPISILGSVLVYFFVINRSSSTLISPLATTPGEVSSATSHDSEIASVEHILREKRIPFLFVTHASSSAYLITLAGNSEVIIKKDDVASQIASLQLIMTRLTMEGKGFARLDLRFDRPVIQIR